MGATALQPAASRGEETLASGSDTHRVLLRGKPFTERFWAYVEKFGPDDCWPWWGHRDEDGYGRIEHAGRSYGAHRIALELRLGRKLSATEVARHKCNNTWCVNGAHLEPGTIADNNRDMSQAGRRAYGDQMSSAKLTSARVVELRERYAKGQTALELARVFGISDRLVGLIAQGKKWPKAGGPISAPRKRRAGKPILGGAQ
jgi:hypothetical protein